MILDNFGSILGFAEEMENQHLELYRTAVRNPDCRPSYSLFESLVKDAEKRVREVQRVRRENVTEMVLAAVEGFSSDPFVIQTGDLSTLDSKGVAATAFELGERSMNYYGQAAERLRGQADVSRALKTLARKHAREQKKLQG